jgi:CRISPR/Cas system-associated exonuclease Cas4 (RecB family)
LSRDIVANLRFKKEATTEGFTAAKLEAAIERGYLSQVREDKFTTKKTFAPSSIGYGHGTCARYWYQAFNGADFVEKTDALGVANMANGSSAHDRLEKVLEAAEVLVAAEIKMEMKDPPIFGYIDALVKIDGETVVGELKTTREEAFMFRKNTMKPSGNHLYQILIYMRATGKQKGFLFYENKNDQTYLVIPVEMTERNAKILDDALDWLRLVRKNWEEGEGTDKNIPQRPWTKRNKICRGCPLFEKCWPEDGEAPTSDVIIPPMEVAKP